MTTKMSAYEELAGQIGDGQSKVVPRILAALLSEEEARLLLAAGSAGTADQLAQRSGLEQEAAEALIDPLLRKGLLFKSKKPEATSYYRIRELLQLLDATAAMSDPPDDLMALWRQLSTELKTRAADVR